MDWSGCNEVEQVPGRVSGAPVLKHSRVFADSIVENYEDGETPESLADMFEVPLEQVRAVLDFAFSRKTTYFENARKPGGGGARLWDIGNQEPSVDNLCQICVTDLRKQRNERDERLPKSASY